MASLAKAMGRWLLLLICLPLACVSGSSRFAQLEAAGYGERYGPLADEFVALLQELESEDVDTQLQRVNHFFNQNIQFTDDIYAWGDSDYWASPMETMQRRAGDCEDFTIAKFTALRLLGVPVDKMRLTYVKARIGGVNSNINQAHMVLSYYENPRDIPLVLDNLVGDIRSADQRPDLVPVFGFNSEGLWVGNQGQASGHDPKARLSRWRDVLLKIQQEGLL